jgi:methylglutaconyl-CoA hydratase
MPNPISDPLVENVIVDDLASVVKLESTLEGVATVTINRPERKNAFDTLAIEGLTEAFETLQGADHVRIVFLRGEGGTFCAGGDLEWMAQAADMTEEDNRSDAMTVAVMLKALADIPAVTVALVEGAAYGGGAGLVAACDMAVAVSGATFAFSEARLGLIPAMIAPYVVNAIGPRRAKSLFVTGRAFDAEHARMIGLVDEVVADAAGLVEARDRLTWDVMACAPGAVTKAKRLVWDVWGRPLDHGLMEDTARRLAKARVSEEGQDGVRSFMERRKPGWATSA